MFLLYSDNRVLRIPRCLPLLRATLPEQAIRQIPRVPRPYRHLRHETAFPRNSSLFLSFLFIVIESISVSTLFLTIPAQFAQNRRLHPSGIPLQAYTSAKLRTTGPLSQQSLWFANWASSLPVTTPSVWTTRPVLPQPISNLSLTLTPCLACRWSTLFSFAQPPLIILFLI